MQAGHASDVRGGVNPHLEIAADARECSILNQHVERAIRPLAEPVRL